MAITAFTALPPVFEQTPNAEKELTLARELMEYAVLFSVSQRDEAAAERNYNQLRPYYQDCAKILPPSPRERLIVGLNLLRLLVQNRIAEFHTELELVPAEAQADPQVQFSVALESHLREGAYGKILAARASVPTPDYAHLMDMLAETVRDEIAACAEKAYATLSRAAAAKLVGVSTEAEMTSLAEARGWRLDATGGAYVFREEAAAPSAKDIPSMELINQTLLYAKELERIV